MERRKWWITLVFVALFVPAVRAQESVGIWDRFEVVLRNVHRYDDPLRDVSLQAVFTAPDGRTLRSRGFYDGDNTWRIRFMPDQKGTWTFSAKFSDGSAATGGLFRCISSDLPGLISADEQNPVWFGFKGGRHFLMRSLHVGDRFFARNWDEPTDPTDGNARTRFLDWAQEQGYNTLSIASHYLNRDQPERGRGWDTPDLWPLNPEAFRQMEAILDELAHRRIVVYPFAGFFGKGSDFPRSQADQDLFLEYTTARMGAYWNVLFLVGGPEPLLESNPHLSEADIHRIGAKIRELDPAGHLVSVHNATGDDVFRDAPWSGYGVLQGPKTLSTAELSAGLLRNHHPSRPLYAQETLWPGNMYHPAYTEDHVRKNAWVALMSAAAVNFADMNGNSSSGFSGTLTDKERVQWRHDLMKRIWDAFEQLPYYRMSPRQDLVSNGFCLAEPGRHYLVYLPEGGSTDVRMEGGPFRVTWINARNPDDRRDGGSTMTGNGFKAPDDRDWLLHVAE